MVRLLALFWTLLLITSAAPRLARAAAQVYALSHDNRLCMLDATTGAMRPVGPALPKSIIVGNEEVSAIDVARGLYWSLGLNASTSSSNAAVLVAQRLSDGGLASALPLPELAPGPLLGFGQMLDVEPASGDLLVCSRPSSSRGGPSDSGVTDTRHRVYRVSAATGAMRRLATVPRDSAQVAIPQSGSALDPEAGTWFLQMVLDNSTYSSSSSSSSSNNSSSSSSSKRGLAPPVLAIVAVDVSGSSNGSAAVTVIDMDFTATPPRGLVTMVRDARTGRIYGFGAPEPPAPGAPPFRSFSDVTAWLRGSIASGGSTSGRSSRASSIASKGAAPSHHHHQQQASPRNLQHTLAYLNVSTREFVQVGLIGPEFLIADSNLQAIDVGARRHLSLLQHTQPPPPAWVDASDCAPGCAPGTLCCRDPEAVGVATGACYTVVRCSAITDGTGQNFSDPFHLVAVDLDSADVVAASAGICSVAGNDCPRSIEVPLTSVETTAFAGALKSGTRNRHDSRENALRQ